MAPFYKKNIHNIQYTIIEKIVYVLRETKKKLQHHLLYYQIEIVESFMNVQIDLYNSFRHRVPVGMSRSQNILFLLVGPDL